MDEFEEFDDLDGVDELVTVTDEDGNELEFIIIDALTHKGSNYLLVAPAEMGEDEYEATIIKQLPESDGDDVIYCLIEDDKEFDEVALIFSSREGDYEIEL